MKKVLNIDEEKHGTNQEFDALEKLKIAVLENLDERVTEIVIKKKSKGNGSSMKKPEDTQFQTEYGKIGIILGCYRDSLKRKKEASMRLTKRREEYEETHELEAAEARNKAFQEWKMACEDVGGYAEIMVEEIFGKEVEDV